MNATTSPALTLPPPHLTARKIGESSSGPIPVYFFLDFSNIAISASRLGTERGDGIYCDRHIRLSLMNLRRLAQRNRGWGSGFAAAAFSSSCSGLRKQMQDAGIELYDSERGIRSGREQNVDGQIQLEMYSLLSRRLPLGVVVLASGDGAGCEVGKGFIPVLQHLNESGFAIEVLSWGHSFNHKLRTWAENHGRSIVLDPFYEDLTFIHGCRNVAPVHALYRKVAIHRLI